MPGISETERSRVDGIGDEVEQDAFELARVGENLRQLFRRVETQGHFRGQLFPEHLEARIDIVVEIGEGGMTVALAGEGEELLHDFGAAPRRLGDRAADFQDAVRILLLHRQERRMPENDRQDIIEVVRDAVGQGADRLQSACFTKALLQLMAKAAFFGLGQGATHRRGQARQALLQDVVGRAITQGFDRRLFADGARNGQAAEIGQLAVGENQVEGVMLQRVKNLAARLDPLDVTGQSLIEQKLMDQLRVFFRILDMENVETRLHALIIRKEFLNSQNDPCYYRTLLRERK
jgi:hypothetical protein